MKINKRLVISGFACPKEPWIQFLGESTDVLSLYDILSNTQSSKLDDWADFVAQEIKRTQPQSIVSHDFGGTTCLTALLKLKKEKVSIDARLTLLNTAFRDFDITKNPHPALIQFAPWAVAQFMIKANGGEIDPKLKPYFSLVKEVYRHIIGLSLMRKVQTRIKQDEPLAIDLGIPSQIIASANDPFISMDTIRRLRSDFNIRDLHPINYGHFPYSGKQAAAVRRAIHLFEEISDEQVRSLDRTLHSTPRSIPYEQHIGS